jgi:hypothetical protein
VVLPPLVLSPVVLPPVVLPPVVLSSVVSSCARLTPVGLLAAVLSSLGFQTNSLVNRHMDNQE